MVRVSRMEWDRPLSSKLMLAPVDTDEQHGVFGVALGDIERVDRTARLI